jgi:hypothetical protein
LRFSAATNGAIIVRVLYTLTNQKGVRYGTSITEIYRGTPDVCRQA